MCIVLMYCIGQGDDHITGQKIATLEMKVWVIFCVYSHLYLCVVVVC